MKVESPPRVRGVRVLGPVVESVLKRSLNVRWGLAFNASVGELIMPVDISFLSCFGKRLEFPLEIRAESDHGFWKSASFRPVRKRSESAWSVGDLPGS